MCLRVFFRQKHEASVQSESLVKLCIESLVGILLYRMIMRRWIAAAFLALLAASLFTPSYLEVMPAAAQPNIAPCGYIDSFDWPVPNINTERTDFGIYRTRFGGLHTGIDVAFYRTGDPVRAAARGEVTYSDIEGWDTEKGVVVIQHTFPDGHQVNTLYGHMEELEGHTFPPMGTCVEAGAIIGAVGDPSLSAPHLHYEVRTRYRREGGPGYTQVNPIELGWLHPVDFTFLARLWAQDAYQTHISLVERPSLAPLLLADNSYLIAQDNHMVNVTASGDLLWEFDTLSTLTGMLELSDGRILTTTANGQVYVMQQGSLSTLWSAPLLARNAPVLVGDVVILQIDSYALEGYTLDGQRLWATPPLDGTITHQVASDDFVIVVTERNTLFQVDVSGNIRYQRDSETPQVPVASPQQGSYLLTDTSILEITPDAGTSMIREGVGPFTANASLLIDETGNSFVYPGEGRALYAYAPDGTLRWIVYMPGSHAHAPLLQMGSGEQLFVLTTDGELLSYDTHDGRLLAHTALFNGGIDGAATTRFLSVDKNDTVRFGSGYLTLIQLDGTLLESTTP